MVLEKSDKTAALVQEGRFGYQSVHYLVRLSQKRCSLPEYSRFSDLIFESQVRTILQHAWAEIEHDIQYKSVETIPDSIRRRFMSLAGMLEIADREFQTIQDDDETLRRAARDSVREGRLRDVEITPDALKAYLDRRFGPDGRMSDSSYQFTAEFLRQMGFRNLQQVAEAITGYKDDATSRTIRKSRHGQLTRFEDTLLAGMGEAYILRHWWGVEPWFINSSLRFLKILHDAGVSIRAYRPSPDVSNGKQFVLRAAIDVARGQVVTDRLSLDRVFSILPDLEQKVLRLLYGFDSDRQQSVEEVAAAIGIPSWQVFQLRTDAFAKLETFDAPSR